MVNIYFSAVIQDMKHFCQCSLLTRRHFKDDFSHELTSSRFTHVYYEKREKMCLFCFRYYRSHFFYLLQVWST